MHSNVGLSVKHDTTCFCHAMNYLHIQFHKKLRQEFDQDKVHNAWQSPFRAKQGGQQ